MRFPIPLSSLLQSDETALQNMMQLIIQGNAYIDSTGVEQLSEAELEKILSQFPTNWELEQFIEAFDGDNLSEDLGGQILAWLERDIQDNTQGETEKQQEQSDSLPNSPTPSYNLDIFNLRDEIIGDYRSYITSFLKIQDPKVKAFVHEQLDQGQLWKDPLVQINPAYQESLTINELIAQNILHPDC
ncbi:MAG: hypothetical protein VKL42_00030, partial [Snowella sp.]|nr:hypothetical protein [Snowella sp.]